MSLVDWLWQGCVVAAVATALARRRAVSASARCALWWGALVLVAAMPFLTLLPGLPGRQAPGDVATGAAAGWPDSDPFTQTGRSWLTIPSLHQPAWVAPLLVGLWAGWVAVGTVRAVSSAIALRRVRARCRPFPDARESGLPHWQSVRHGARATRLSVSDDVPWAAVLGGRSPTIAIAPRALHLLADEELDQVVLHEWAHVRRRDDQVGVVQLAVHVLFGAHPAAWWIDRQLRREREVACDDLAAGIAGSRRQYARCLAKLAELRVRIELPVLAASASSQIGERIGRLLDPSRDTSTRISAWVIVAPALVLMAVASLTTRVSLVAARPPTIATEAPSRPASGEIARLDMPLSVPDVEPRGARVARATKTPSNPAAPARALPLRRDETVVPPVAITPPDNVEPADTVPAPDSQPADRAPAPLASRSLTLTSSLPDGEEPSPREGMSPWDAAAQAGVAVGKRSQEIGKGSQKAAVAVAGFFSGWSRKVAGAWR